MIEQSQNDRTILQWSSVNTDIQYWRVHSIHRLPHDIEQRDCDTVQENHRVGRCSRSSSVRRRRQHTDEHQPRRECTGEYAELYCSNGQCYLQMNTNGEDAPYCNCTTGYYGRRCEYRGIGQLHESVELTL